MCFRKGRKQRKRKKKTYIQQFLAFPQSFLQDFPQFCQSFPKQSRVFMTLKEKPFENIVGKAENSGNQHFSLLPQCFNPIREILHPFSHTEIVLCKCFQF